MGETHDVKNPAPADRVIDLGSLPANITSDLIRWKVKSAAGLRKRAGCISPS